MMLGDGDKIPAHGAVETVWLPPMRGDAPSSANHILMWLTAHQFEVTSHEKHKGGRLLGEPHTFWLAYLVCRVGARVAFPSVVKLVDE